MKSLRLMIALALLTSCGGNDFSDPLYVNPEVPNAPQISSVGGKVYDAGTGMAIEGADVSAANTTTHSAVDGRYQLTGITNRVILLEVTKAGYQSRSVGLPVNPGHNEFQLPLTKLPD